MYRTFPSQNIVNVSWLSLIELIVVEVSGILELDGEATFSVPPVGMRADFPGVAEFDPSENVIFPPSVPGVPNDDPFTAAMIANYYLWTRNIFDDTETEIIPGSTSTAPGVYLSRKFDVDYSRMEVPFPTAPFATEGDARAFANALDLYGENDFEYVEITGDPIDIQISSREAGGMIFVSAKKFFQLSDPAPVAEFEIWSTLADRVSYTVKTYRGPFNFIQSSLVDELEVSGGKYVDLSTEETLYRRSRITFTIDKETLEITSDAEAPIEV